MRVSQSRRDDLETKLRSLRSHTPFGFTNVRWTSIRGCRGSLVAIPVTVHKLPLAEVNTTTTEMGPESESLAA